MNSKNTLHWKLNVFNDNMQWDWMLALISKPYLAHQRINTWINMIV